MAKSHYMKAKEVYVKDYNYYYYLKSTIFHVIFSIIWDLVVQMRYFNLKYPLL
jgi:hypothetical protein